MIFITSRFRSGSTVLWNVFRSVDECTAFYEPFNERQWFDIDKRGEHVDQTHVGVDDYSKEYNELSCLSDYYQEHWIDTSLLMDEDFWDPAMEAYINGMVEKSPHRPVLQFNRIDFRLPWFKKHYPHAKFLHLYRNPRDQWCSFLIDKEKMNKDDVETTYRDAFYLDVWCDDLVVHYPFLSKKVTPHPYQRFYYLWKLSFLVGQKHCDISISFEQLTDNPTEIISSIFKAFGISENYVATAAGVIQKPTKNRWKSYANNDWFKHHELICERYLTRFLDK